MYFNIAICIPFSEGDESRLLDRITEFTTTLEGATLETKSFDMTNYQKASLWQFWTDNRKHKIFIFSLISENEILKSVLARFNLATMSGEANLTDRDFGHFPGHIWFAYVDVPKNHDIIFYNLILLEEIDGIKAWVKYPEPTKLLISFVSTDPIPKNIINQMEKFLDENNNFVVIGTHQI